MKLELGEKNELVALNEKKPMIPKFKVSGQPMTSEVTHSGPLVTSYKVHCNEQISVKIV